MAVLDICRLLFASHAQSVGHCNFWVPGPMDKLFWRHVTLCDNNEQSSVDGCIRCMLKSSEAKESLHNQVNALGFSIDKSSMSDGKLLIDNTIGRKKSDTVPLTLQSLWHDVTLMRPLFSSVWDPQTFFPNFGTSNWWVSQITFFLDHCCDQLERFLWAGRATTGSSSGFWSKFACVQKGWKHIQPGCPCFDVLRCSLKFLWVFRWASMSWCWCPVSLSAGEESMASFCGNNAQRHYGSPAIETCELSSCPGNMMFSCCLEERVAACHDVSCSAGFLRCLFAMVFTPTARAWRQCTEQRHRQEESWKQFTRILAARPSGYLGRWYNWFVNLHDLSDGG